jgi:hypothetical protein
MSKNLVLDILKEYYNQGDNYYCGEESDYYWASYSNDYPMQHGYGIEIRLFKSTNKTRAYQRGYRYKLPEDKLNQILCQKK